MALSTKEPLRKGVRGRVTVVDPSVKLAEPRTVTIQLKDLKILKTKSVTGGVLKPGKIVVIEASSGQIIQGKMLGIDDSAIRGVTRMPGFRPGKIPSDLVRKMFEGQVIKPFEPDDEALCMIEGKAMFEEDLLKSGGCFDLEQAQLLLGNISRQAVDQRVQKGSLIAVTGDGNKRVYPVFQFHNGKLLPGLAEVLAVLPKTHEWALVNFFVNPDAFDDRSPVEALRQNDIEAALAAARDFADSGV
jgi:hypothetical protein